MDFTLSSEVAVAFPSPSHSFFTAWEVFEQMLKTETSKISSSARA